MIDQCLLVSTSRLVMLRALIDFMIREENKEVYLVELT